MRLSKTPREMSARDLGDKLLLRCGRELAGRVEKVLALIDGASPILNHPAAMRFAAKVRQILEGE